MMAKLPKYVFWIAILFCWPSMALSQDKFSMTDQNGKLTLETKKPCELGPWFKAWKAATWMFRGELYPACWRVQEEPDERQHIVVIDSSGIVSSHRPRAFKSDEGI